MKLLNCAALLLSSCLLVACGQVKSPAAAKSPKATEIDRVATINGKILSRPELEEHVDTIENATGRYVLLTQRPQILDQLIGLHLAAEDAEKLGLDKDPKIIEQLALARIRVLSEAAIQHYLNEHPVTKEELKPAYEAAVAKFSPEYKTSQILLDNPGTAEEIIEKLKKGADFAKLAAKVSKDPTKLRGGDVGWAIPQAMTPEYAKAVFELKVGEITPEPVKTTAGWHVIRLDGVRAQEVTGGFDAVTNQISVMVKNQRVNEYVENLRKAAKIEKDPRGPNPTKPNSTELVPTPTTDDPLQMGTEAAQPQPTQPAKP